MKPINPLDAPIPFAKAGWFRCPLCETPFADIPGEYGMMVGEVITGSCMSGHLIMLKRLACGGWRFGITNKLSSPPKLGESAP